ncbi:hypothetical protein SAMN02745673_03607 [Marinactinospora thermotolerans DSM 45154]|uniref:Uncharacterized protein n=1 Tax=Marinactinospora thermotolerans DSM 45154 TaxID=1122192 RepID=A0A1T4SKM8_9ACTN|nr:hypothetical protein SAMN02745673_03607 [Marinactinospora thermotolerans DSM 45154]
MVGLCAVSFRGGRVAGSSGGQAGRRGFRGALPTLLSRFPTRRKGFPGLFTRRRGRLGSRGDHLG